MTKRQLYHLWDFVSRIVGALPPIAVACYCFPIWVRTGSKPVVSGGLVVVTLIASIPFYKKFKSMFEFVMNASMPVLWTIGAGIFYVLMNISGQMFAICIGGLVGSALSALVCMQRNRYADRETPV